MMQSRFVNKTFVITGAASGIGLATARLLKLEGAHVTLWDVNADGLAAAGAALNAPTAQVDVTDPAAVRGAFETVVGAGRLDGVVHSAGILRTGLFEATPIEQHRRTVEVNLFGSLNVAHAALPYLKAAHGSLVLLGSTAAFYGTPEVLSYSTTKAGVLSLAQGLRVELVGTEVHVGVVCPLGVDSPMLSGENRSVWYVTTKSPLVNMWQPEQVARVIVDGIHARKFLIFPGWRAQLVYTLSRYAAWAGHRVMLRSWRG